MAAMAYVSWCGIDSTGCHRTLLCRGSRNVWLPRSLLHGEYGGGGFYPYVYLQVHSWKHQYGSYNEVDRRSHISQMSVSSVRSC